MHKNGISNDLPGGRGPFSVIAVISDTKKEKEKPAAKGGRGPAKSLQDQLQQTADHYHTQNRKIETRAAGQGEGKPFLPVSAGFCRSDQLQEFCGVPKPTEQARGGGQANRTGGNMTEFTFYLSAEDTDRVFAIKELQGAADLTANEFARQLLQQELRRLFPAVPHYDSDGQLSNADRYRGSIMG